MAEPYGYTRRELGRDLALVWSVGVVLVVVHLLVPAPERARLAFDHTRFDAVSLYTSAFVHVDGAHLLGNLAGYLATTTVAYGLCLQAGARRWFRLTVVSFLVGLPAVLGVTNYALLGMLYPGIDPITRGFSGVGAAFTGYVLLALLEVVRTTHGRLQAAYVGLALWLWLLLEVFLIYGGAYLPVALALAALGWLFSAWGLRAAGDGERVVEGLRRAGDAVWTVVLVGLLLTFVVLALFPADPVDGGTVTNVVAHAAGFGYGLAGAGLTHRVVYR